MTDTPGMPSRIDAGLDRLGLLLEPMRRRVFATVSSAPAGLTRDLVAERLGIDRALATFHLERLLEGGLVDADFPRTPSEGARRRGRPAKRYRASNLGIELSVPARDYRLAAELFAEALAQGDRPAALDIAARTRGESVGRSARARSRRAAPRTAARAGDRFRASVVAALVDEGYEPRRQDDGSVCLANCPFDALAREHRDVICPTNLAFLEGVLEGSGTDALKAVLDPADGRCCVLLVPAAPEGPPSEGHPAA